MQAGSTVEDAAVMAEQESEPVPVLVLDVSKPGRYILLDDVILQMRSWAEQTDSITERDLLLHCANLFGVAELPQGSQDAPPTAEAGSELSVPTSAAEGPSAPLVSVARIEIYPEEEAPGKIYWYARAVNAEGAIVDGPYGQINRDGIGADAERRWPGVPHYEVENALADSIFAETNPAATWNGRARPSTRRLFGQ